MIIHVDMDAFYASIEIRDNPALANLPVVVGGSVKHRGVVAAASYEARKYGVFSAMPASMAMRKCPRIIFLPVDMKKYLKVSTQIQNIFLKFTPVVEPLALDEAFLDVTHSEKLFGSSASIGRKIKQVIKSELRLDASVGVARTKFIAKIASDFDKPDGFVQVPVNGEQDFLDPLPIHLMWGIGKSSLQRYLTLGIKTFKDIRLRTKDFMGEEFGQQGRSVWELANGIDTRTVSSQTQIKSISHERTFAKDIADIPVLMATLLELVEQVGQRLRKKNKLYRTVTLKLRDSDFKTISRSKTLEQSLDSTSSIWHTAKALLNTVVQNRGRLSGAYRLIGVGVSGFQAHPSMQQSLFNNSEPDCHSEIDKVTDQIRERYGDKSIARAKSKSSIES